MEAWLLTGFIVLLASVSQASTGFGFSIMATPFLLLVYGVHDAIQINIILSLAISTYMALKIGKDTDRALLGRLLRGSIAGLPLGIPLFLLPDITFLKIFISLVILVLTLLLTMNFRIRQTSLKDLISGGISGVLTTSIGMPGPPLLLYFSGVGTEKGVIRSTTLSFYVFVYSVSLFLQIMFSGTSKVIWVSSALSLPIVLLGIFLGEKLFSRIDQKVFRVITYSILFFTGLYLLASSLGV